MEGREVRADEGWELETGEGQEVGAELNVALAGKWG